MRILITGGAGKVGCPVTDRLIRSGWDVRVIDIQPDVEIPGAQYIQCDIMNYADLRAAMRGCDVVAHLAAIPSPSRMPGPDVFRINVAGTFNVFEAASAEGIRRIVHASSINAIGCAYNLTDLHVRYLPIDEDHPVFTTDPYAFSKQLIEDVGAYFWRREGVSSAALRLPGVWHRVPPASPELSARRQRALALLDDLAAQPEVERRAVLDAARQRVLAYRRQRPFEFPTAPMQAIQKVFADDPLGWMVMIDQFNFWAYVDERDSAQAFEKCLTADFEGSHVLFITAASNWLDYDSQTLARLFFPDVTTVSLGGSDTLISIERARALIGYEPEHSMGDDHDHDR